MGSWIRRTVSGAVCVALVASGLQVLPAQADPAKARKRPAVAGMKLTEPHAVPKAVDRGRGKVTLPVWTDPTKQVSVAEGTTVVDLKGPAKARGKGGVLVKAAKNSSKGKTGKASKATVTTKAGRTTSGQPVALVSVKTDLPDTVTVNADPAVLGAGAGRAQLFALSNCDPATSTSLAGCTSTPVASSLTVDGLTATVAASATMQTFAMAASSSGSEGDFSATPFSPSSTWTAGGSSGDFTWSYGLDLPPTSASFDPELGLSYSSSVVDGRTSSANNQASWVGEGFSLGEGSISRNYVPCAKDMTGSNTTTKTGDLCWGSDEVLFVSFGAHSGELVQVGTTGVYRLRSDDGTRFERKTSASNGVTGGEYWVMTTTDGTQYVFGNTTTTAWTVPVVGNHSGEPGYNSSYASSFTTQAWSWKLSTVTDVHGNQIKYSWATETNNYGKNNNTSGVATYVRGGYLTKIDYGQTTTNPISNARVSFTVGDRCSGTDCSTAVSNQIAWPDVPLDQICTSTSSCATQISPTFFTLKKLTKATTSTLTATSVYTPLQSWAFTYQFPAPGDGTRPSLWLSKIENTTAGDSAVLTTTFAGMAMESRVDGVEHDGQAADPFYKFRVVSVNTDSATQINVVYTTPECTPAMVASLDPATNTKRCFPSQFSPNGSDTTTRHWFHKYAVTSVTINDLTGASPIPEVTNYSYGDPAWRWNDSPGVLTKDRDWSIFAGFASVTTSTGSGETGTPLKTMSVFYQGLHGDKAASGTKTVSVAGNGVDDTDDWWKAGTTRETITYNGATIVSRQVNTPSAFITVATNSDGRVAGHAGASNAKTTVPLAAGGNRTTETTTTLDAVGNATQVNDLGDTSIASDDVCARSTYIAPGAAWIAGKPFQVSIRTGACGSWPAAPSEAQVVSDTKYTYDGAAFGSLTKGLLTKTEQATAVSGGSLTYATMSQAGYDGRGRLTSATDAAGQLTATSYTENALGRLTGLTVSSPDPDGGGSLSKHVTSSTIDPAFGVPTKVVAPGGETRELTLDRWGRVTQVWSPLMLRSDATWASKPTTKYTYQWPAVNKPAAIKAEHYQAAGNYVSSIVLMDGQGRTRESQTQAIDQYVNSSGAVLATTGRVVAGQRYDSRGLQTVTTGGILKSGAPSMALSGTSDAEVESLTTTEYDGAGRATATKLYSLNVFKWTTSTITYGGDRVTTVPAEGAMPSTVISDARGNTTSMLAYKDRAMTGGYDTFSYSYNVKNLLSGMTDAGGNTWSYGYDLLGRRTSVKDPNATAAATTIYDLRGLITSTKNPNGTILTYAYDNLGRPTSLSDSAGVRSSWSYDAVKKGYQDTAVRKINGVAVTTKTTGFTPAGDPLATTLTMPVIAGLVDTKLAGTFTTNYGYNYDGTVSRLTTSAFGNLPAETITYGYDAIGRPTGMVGNSSYLGDVVYSALGQVKQTAQQNTNNQTVWYTSSFDQATGRVTNSLLDRQLQPQADADVSYTYDQSGNLTGLSSLDKVTAGAQRDTQCFSRDHLGRLTQAWTTTASSCGAATFAGPAPYRLSWTYDSSNNRTSETSYTSATVSASSAWSFPTAGSAKPNQVSQVAVTPAGATTPISTSYTYDAAGNTTARWTGNAITTGGTFTKATMAYDNEGKLASTTIGAQAISYYYSATGDRLIRKNGNTTTLYLGDVELTQTTAGGTPTAVRQYTALGKTVATRSGANNADIAWVFSDLNNTGSWQINSVTSAVATRRTTPFGANRGVAASWKGTQGFVGGTIDKDAGFTHLGARDYDTFAGRFLTMDPVLSADSPLEWNPYAYGAWNPVGNPDPSGLKICLETCNTMGPNLRDKLTQDQWIDNYDAAFQAQPKTPWSTAAITDMSGKTDGRYSESLNKIIGAVKYQRYYKKDASGPDYRPKSSLLAKNLIIFHVYVATIPLGGPLWGAALGGIEGAAGYGMTCGSNCTASGAMEATAWGAGLGALLGFAGKIFGRLGAKAAGRATKGPAAKPVAPPLTPEELLMPGGKRVGTVGGNNKTIREMEGGVAAAKKMFEDLRQGGTLVFSDGKRTLYSLPGGGRVQYRTEMSNSPGIAVTIDVTIPGINISKLKYGK